MFIRVVTTASILLFMVSSVFPTLQPVIWTSTTSVLWTCPACAEPITPNGGVAFTWSVRSALMACRSQVGFTSHLYVLACAWLSGHKDVRCQRLCDVRHARKGGGKGVDCQPGSNLDQFWHSALFSKKPNLPNCNCHMFTLSPLFCCWC